MMRLLKRTNNLLLAMFLMSIVVLSGCGSGESSEQVDEKDSLITITDSLMQSPDDLLVGVSRAICYSGFRKGQHPDRGDGANNPSEEEILEDLQILTRDSNFTLMRMYDCGENTQDVLKVIADNNIGMKVMLGVWLKAELSAHETCFWLNEPIPEDVLAANKLRNLEQIETGIELANKYPEIIVAVNVGNEALVEWNDHKVDVDTIISYVKKVQAAVKQPVTVADNYDWWAQNGQELAKVVDFVSIHAYPLWEGKDIDSAMIFTQQNVLKVRKALPDSKIVITEAGWTSVASEFGERASEDKQLKYYNDLLAFAAEKNITTFIFEAFDESWKGNPDNAMGAEKHWGIFTEERKAKKVMHELYPDLK